MKDPLSKTPVELWEILQEIGRENPLVRRVIDCNRFHGLTPEHAALGLATALLEQNKEMEKHILDLYKTTPLATFIQPKG